MESKESSVKGKLLEVRTYNDPLGGSAAFLFLMGMSPECIRDKVVKIHLQRGINYFDSLEPIAGIMIGADVTITKMPRNDSLHPYYYHIEAKEDCIKDSYCFYLAEGKKL